MGFKPRDPDCFIKHKLTVPTTYPPYLLVRDCLLSQVPGPPKVAPRSFSSNRVEYRLRRTQLVALHRGCRMAHFRLIDKHPEDRRRLVYALNCVPAGVKAFPVTRMCRNAYVCPWCFARNRLFRIRDEVIAAAPSDRMQLVSWYRDFDWDPRSVKELPFLAHNCFPKDLLPVTLTMQTCVPFVGEQNDIKLRHIGLHVLPAAFDLNALQRDWSFLETVKVSRSITTESQIRLHLAEILTFDWLRLYRHPTAFEALLYGPKKPRLLRISRQKPELAKELPASIPTRESALAKLSPEERRLIGVDSN